MIKLSTLQTELSRKKDEKEINQNLTIFSAWWNKRDFFPFLLFLFPSFFFNDDYVLKQSFFFI